MRTRALAIPVLLLVGLTGLLVARFLRPTTRMTGGTHQAPTRPDDSHRPDAFVVDPEPDITPAAREIFDPGQNAWQEALHEKSVVALEASRDLDGPALIEVLLAAAGLIVESAPIDRPSLHFEREDEHWGGKPAVLRRRLQFGQSDDPMGYLRSTDGSVSFDEFTPSRSITLSWQRPLAGRLEPLDDRLNQVAELSVSIWSMNEKDGDLTVGCQLAGPDSSVANSDVRRFREGAYFEDLEDGATIEYGGLEVDVRGGRWNEKRALSVEEADRMRAALHRFLHSYEARIARVLAGVPSR